MNSQIVGQTLAQLADQLRRGDGSAIERLRAARAHYPVGVAFFLEAIGLDSTLAALKARDTAPRPYDAVFRAFEQKLDKIASGDLYFRRAICLLALEQRVPGYGRRSALEELALHCPCYWLDRCDCLTPRHCQRLRSRDASRVDRPEPHEFLQALHDSAEKIRLQYGLRRAS